MAIINVYKTDKKSFVFTVGELKEDAPIVGVKPINGATDDEVIAEVRSEIDFAGGTYFAMFGGALNLALLNKHNPQLIASWEADDIDASDFAEVHEAKE